MGAVMSLLGLGAALGARGLRAGDDGAHAARLGRGLHAPGGHVDGRDGGRPGGAHRRQHLHRPVARRVRRSRSTTGASWPGARRRRPPRRSPGATPTGRRSARCCSTACPADRAPAPGPTAPTAAGSSRRRRASATNIETNELHYPQRYLWRRERPDSAGPGRWRGGVGAEHAYVLHHADGADHLDGVRPRPPAAHVVGRRRWRAGHPERLPGRPAAAPTGGARPAPGRPPGRHEAAAAQADGPLGPGRRLRQLVRRRGRLGRPARPASGAGRADDVVEGLVTVEGSGPRPRGRRGRRRARRPVGRGGRRAATVGPAGRPAAGPAQRARPAHDPWTATPRAAAGSRPRSRSSRATAGATRGRGRRREGRRAQVPLPVVRHVLGPVAGTRRRA